MAQQQPPPEPPGMGFDYFPSFSAPSFNAGATYDAMFGSAEAIPEPALQKKGAGDAGNLLRNYKSGAPAGQQAAGDGVWRRGVNLDDQMGGPKAGGAAAEVEMRSSPAGGLDLLATQRRALAGGAGSRANGYEEDPPAAHRNSYDAGVDLSSGEEGEERDEVLEAHGPRGSVRGSSALLQLKLMLWKQMLTKLRDRGQLIASLVAPFGTFVIMWLLRKKPYQSNADFFLVNVAFVLQPLAQVAGLVSEKQKGLKVLLTTSGLSPAIFTLSWFLAEVIGAAVTALLLAIFCRLTDVLEVNGAVSFFMVLALLFCYLCGSAAFAFCLSQPFSKPSTAAPATFIAYLGFLFTFLFLALERDKMDRATGCVDLYPDTITPEMLVGGGDDDDDGYGDDSYGGGGGGGRFLLADNSTQFALPGNCTGLLDMFGKNYTNQLCARSNPEALCVKSCGRCRPVDFVDVSGWTDDEQQYVFTLIPTWALTLAVRGLTQGKPPVWFRWPLRGLCVATVLYMVFGWCVRDGLVTGVVAVPITSAVTACRLYFPFIIITGSILIHYFRLCWLLVPSALLDVHCAVLAPCFAGILARSCRESTARRGPSGSCSTRASGVAAFGRSGAWRRAAARAAAAPSPAAAAAAGPSLPPRPRPPPSARASPRAPPQEATTK